MKIACWSGPRNLSTAMMYSFRARGDCAVWDEPFYGAYLAKSGIDHPMRDEIIAKTQSDPEKVAAQCGGPIPGDKPHFYMKHMGLHMLDGFSLDWATACTNIHIIRHPARVIASYAAKRENITSEDIGFEQQLALYERVGGTVVDTEAIRANPEVKLRQLCEAIDLPFTPNMLNWPASGIPEDGIWGKHWYGAIHKSTGFAGPEGPLPVLSDDHLELCDGAIEIYNTLKSLAI